MQWSRSNINSSQRQKYENELLVMGPVTQTVVMATDLKPHLVHSGALQMVRGHFLPARAHRELPGQSGGAKSLQNTLHIELG